jgi:membrane associated rhomboid family serine protease
MSLDLGPSSLRRTPIALALIAVNVAVFLALTAVPGLEEVLGLPAGWEEVAERPWTLVSVTFTAGNLLHLAGAVAFVLVFGRELEELASGLHLLAVYVLAGLAGSAALTTLASSTGLEGISLGASASFLGLFGAIAVLPVSARLERLPLRPILAAIVLVNVVGPLMDIGGWASSAAHGAGLAVGALYGWALRSRERTEVSRPHDAAAAPRS